MFVERDRDFGHGLTPDCPENATDFDHLALCFPDWPRNCDIETRPEELKMKDSRHFHCVGVKINPGGCAFVYQFESKPLRSRMVLFRYMAAEPRNLSFAHVTCFANRNKYWHAAGGFRGLKVKKTKKAYVEIPSPAAVKEIEPWYATKYLLVEVDDFLSDLEFATLQSEYDFVIGRKSSFYHDMLAHFAPFIYQTQRLTAWRMTLKNALAFYSKWQALNSPDCHTKSLIEFCFGIAADLQRPIELESILPCVKQFIMPSGFANFLNEVKFIVYEYNQDELIRFVVAPFFEDLRKHSLCN